MTAFRSSTTSYFKKVDENTLMCIMNGKTLPDATVTFPEGAPLFTFVLERDG